MILAIPYLALLSGIQAPIPAGQAEKVTVKDDLVGSGHVARSGDVVTIDYTGALKDGTEFDSSKGRAPLTFILGIGQVIKGMDKGLEGMHEGGKRILTIPPTLGYGTEPVGTIPPNSTLVFTVDLVRIEPKVASTVLVKGAGPGAKLNDVIYAFVKVKLESGKVITDTRESTKDPVPLQVGERRMPIGLLAGLLGTQAGETLKIVVPPSLAFPKGVPVQDQGTVKAGSVIPPKSVIEFDVEVVKIEPPTPPKPAHTGNGG